MPLIAFWQTPDINRTSWACGDPLSRQNASFMPSLSAFPFEAGRQEGGWSFASDEEGEEEEAGEVGSFLIEETSWLSARSLKSLAWYWWSSSGRTSTPAFRRSACSDDEEKEDEEGKKDEEEEVGFTLIVDASWPQLGLSANRLSTGPRHSLCFCCGLLRPQQ